MRAPRSFAIASALSLLVAAQSATAGSIGLSRPEELGFSRTRLKALSEFFEAEVAAGTVPGAMLLVQRRGQPAYFEAFGVRDVATKAPMTPDTLFRIYSMTKPITSVTAMMLVQDGKLSLNEPVSKYIPAFARARVGLRKTGEDGKPVLELVPVHRPMTIQDLLRHTSGIAYSYSGQVEVDERDAPERLEATRLSNEEFAEHIAARPLSQQPGTIWEYSYSTDVLGRVIEVVEGKPLFAVMKARLFDPLGMKDTSFYVTDTAKHSLIAEPLPADGGSGENAMFNPRNEMKWQSGGGGLVSTINDYARFAQMITNRGSLDGQQYLSPKIFDWMASDHISPSTGISPGGHFLPGPGYGFGLGFGVRLEQGASALPGSVGELYWGGVGGTYFWADPKEELFAVLMIQSFAQRARFRTVVKNLFYSSLDKPN
jgi:CubicO group peptidase (beta-lactamase class C family)